MLPPFIIEQIRHRERREQSHRPRPHLEIPIEIPPLPCPSERSVDEEVVERGVITIDLFASSPTG